MGFLGASAGFWRWADELSEGEKGKRSQQLAAGFFVGLVHFQSTKGCGTPSGRSDANVRNRLVWPGVGCSTWNTLVRGMGGWDVPRGTSQSRTQAGTIPRKVEIKNTAFVSVQMKKVFHGFAAGAPKMSLQLLERKALAEQAISLACRKRREGLSTAVPRSPQCNSLPRKSISPYS